MKSSDKPKMRIEYTLVIEVDGEEIRSRPYFQPEPVKRLERKYKYLAGYTTRIDTREVPV